MKHLLIDGRNIIYRATYAGLGDKLFMQTGADLFVVFARFIHHYQTELRPTSVHVFWDDDKANLWRTKILPTYKGNRSQEPSVSEAIDRQFKIILDTYRYLGIRQYFAYSQEADDLIYAFCRARQDDIIIVSSDKDLRQIKASNISIYDPGRKIIIEDRISPIAKALMGDKSDNIDGYHRIGPKTADSLASDRANLDKFLDRSGRQIFDRNINLVDFSLNPNVHNNIEYVLARSLKPVQYDYAQAISRLKHHKVNGIMRESYKLFSSLSTLV